MRRVRGRSLRGWTLRPTDLDPAETAQAEDAGRPAPFMSPEPEIPALLLYFTAPVTRRPRPALWLIRGESNWDQTHKAAPSNLSHMSTDKWRKATDSPRMLLAEIALPL
jgi:hypothetical protein